MREEFKNIKYLAKNAKTPSFLGMRRVLEYQISRKERKAAKFFRDAKSLRISNISQRTQRRKVFFRAQRVKEYQISRKERKAAKFFSARRV